MRIAANSVSDDDGTGSAASSSLVPPTSRLARMLARAPMMPSPATMMNIPAIRPPTVMG